MNNQELIAEIKRLKQKHNAVILGHYYAPAEVQDIADFLGDSLALSFQAAETSAKTILFAGVHFMAETAAILSPEKVILTPTQYAGCSLAEGISAEGLRSWREAHPDGLIVSYVNTTAEVKAETDYCCTSANALKVVASLPADRPILFGPDQNLGRYISKRINRPMELWPASCFVHDRIDTPSITQALNEYPDADILIHPESKGAADEEILANERCYMYSTTGILEHIVRSSKQRFVIATEPGVLHQAQKRAPNKTLIPIQASNACHYMKQGGIWEIYEALRDQKHIVQVPDDIRARTLLPIRRMMEIV